MLTAFGLFGIPTTSHALLVDGFGTPQAALQDFAGPSVASSSVAGPDILSGERDAVVGSTTLPGITGATRFEVAGGLARFSADPSGAGQTGLHYNGFGSSTSGASAVPRMDFTDGGASDRFIIEVSSVSGFAQVLINVGAAGLAAPLQSDWIALAGGPVEILFSSFHFVGGPFPGQNFDAAAHLQIAVDYLGGATVSIDAICTGSAGAHCSSVVGRLPVPATLLLALAGLGALGWQRRQQGTAASTVAVTGAG